MSRLFEVYQDRMLAQPPMVYRGEFTGNIWVQFPWPSHQPLALPDLRSVENLRDKLTAFLEAAYEEAK